MAVSRMIVAGVEVEISNPEHVKQQVRALRPGSPPLELGVVFSGRQGTVLIPAGTPVLIFD